MSTNVRKSNRTSAKKIVLVGVFGAISTVLMLLSFNVPFIPTFVKLDFSDLPVLGGGGGICARGGGGRGGGGGGGAGGGGWGA